MLFYLLAGVAVIAIFFIIVMLVDGNRFVVREYTIESEKIKDGIDLAVMADLHNKQYGSKNAKLFSASERISRTPRGLITGEADGAKQASDPWNSGTPVWKTSQRNFRLLSG